MTTEHIATPVQMPSDDLLAAFLSDDPNEFWDLHAQLYPEEIEQ